MLADSDWAMFTENNIKTIEDKKIPSKGEEGFFQKTLRLVTTMKKKILSQNLNAVCHRHLRNKYVNF